MRGTIEDITWHCIVSYRVRLIEDDVVRCQVDQLGGISKSEQTPETVIYENLTLPGTQTLNPDLNEILDQTVPPNLSDTPHLDI